MHYRRFLSLPSIKLSWLSADPSSGQGGLLLLLPHHTLNKASVAKAEGSCSQPLQSSQPHSELAFGGPKQGRAQRHPFYLSSLTAPFCTSHINGCLWVQPTGRKTSPMSLREDDSNSFQRSMQFFFIQIMELQVSFFHSKTVLKIHQAVEKSSLSVFLVRAKGF